MQEENQPLQTLEDIKDLMTKSSRFISLSGWSGVAAGICALIAAWIAHQKISQFHFQSTLTASADDYSYLKQQLLILAALTFVAAFILAFLFTYLRSRKN